MMTGFMTKTELEMFQSVPSTEFNTFWIPCTWFINVLREARQECRITDSNGLKLIMEELNEFRSKCGLLWGYDWISIPLVYTQVVTMATYAFFVACMFGRQNVNDNSAELSSIKHRYDYYIPIFTILQLMFYMGLLKVAEQLINPFGDDDEDFELNWIIDRHMKVSYLGVDTLNGTPPPLVRDTYYDELDVKIPYTEASKSYKKKTYRGSVAYMQVPMEQQGMVLPDMSEEEDDGETVSETMGPRRPSVYTLFHSRGSNCKGVSPASSFTNLDNRSIASIDSEWKCSLPNISFAAKNASGTLGYNEASPPFMDMAKAEDDEIVLQEVVIEPSPEHRPSISRSDSLQIPGLSGRTRGKKTTSMLSLLRELSPKIAPKFPREKLKSMFRKGRKLSAAFPFYKLKGVHFTRGTKQEEQAKHSLLDVSYQEPVEVEITLSTPELTEIEKETGVHPYYFTQQTISSAKEMVTGRAFSVRQSQYGSQDGKPRGIDPITRYMTRSNSLPNLRDSDHLTAYIRDPIIESSLRKVSAAIKNKEKSKTTKKKKKRKSPPPRPVEQHPPSGAEEPPREEKTIEPESKEPRRNTLPQITLTRAQEHLESVMPISSLGHSSYHSSDSIILDSPTIKCVSPLRESPSPVRAPLQRRVSEPSKSPDKTKKSGVSRRESKSHSIKPSLQPPHPKPPQTVTLSASDDSTPRTTSSNTRKKSSPPPKRPETLSYTPTSSKTPSPKLQGLFLKSTEKTSPVGSKSAPTSPIADIPTTSKVSRSPSFPKTSKKSTRSTSPSPKRSPKRETPIRPQVPRTQTDNVIINIPDDQEYLESVDQRFNQSARPPEPPQRHVLRSSSRGKK